MDKNEVKQIIIRLHDIAKELRKSFDNPEVVVEFHNRYGGVSEEIYYNLLDPIYFPYNQHLYGVRMEGGKAVAIKKDKDSEWVSIV